MVVFVDRTSRLRGVPQIPLVATSPASDQARAVQSSAGDAAGASIISRCAAMRTALPRISTTTIALLVDESSVSRGGLNALQVRVDLDELECILANLIYGKYVSVVHPSRFDWWCHPAG